MEPPKFCSETHSPTAEAQARAGEVLIWKEGVTAHLLIWYISAKTLTQGLKEGEQKRYKKVGKKVMGLVLLTAIGHDQGKKCWFS